MAATDELGSQALVRSGASTEALPLLFVELQDKLAKAHALPPEVAAACVDAFAAVAASVEPAEVVAALRALRRIQKRHRDDRIRAQLRTGNAAIVAKLEGVSVSRVYEIAGKRVSRAS